MSLPRPYRCDGAREEVVVTMKNYRVALDELPWETSPAGDVIVFPAGEADRHRPRALTDHVRMIFLEETAAVSSVDSSSHQ